MNKIKTLTLENFKFFYGKYDFNFDGKNILLYGENGSGKSSIYWALYTLLQSSNKSIKKIQRYFSFRNKRTNLLNKFMSLTDERQVSITLTDDSIFTITKSEDAINTINETMKEANIASDFINYKLLAKLYDFKHSDEIDLFELFRSDIFDYMKFDENRTYSQVWKRLKEYEDNPPKKNTYRYTWFNQLIEKFNNKLNDFLQTILSDINTILQESFYKNLVVKYIYKPLEYDDEHYYRVYRTLINPEINITVKYEHEAILHQHSKVINKPHTFLNEAKLTAIALSIRFSILRTRVASDGILKILVLDDLLISLDMSNRDIVLKMLLEDEYLKDYQMIMLTHDKVFFEKSKQIFDYKARGKWKYFEMYVDIDEERGFEIPYVKEYGEKYGNMQKVDEHFKNKDYPACANYLRKEVESKLNKFLRLDDLDEKIRLAKFKENVVWIRSFGKDIKKTLKILEYFKECKNVTNEQEVELCVKFSTQVIESIESLNEYIKNDFHFEEFEDVKLILKSILHPQSHNDITKPLYKKELEDAIELVEAFGDILTRSHGLRGNA